MHIESVCSSLLFCDKDHFFLSLSCIQTKILIFYSVNWKRFYSMYINSTMQLEEETKHKWRKQTCSPQSPAEATVMISFRRHEAIFILHSLSYVWPSDPHTFRSTCDYHQRWSKQTKQSFHCIHKFCNALICHGNVQMVHWYKYIHIHTCPPPPPTHSSWP